MTVGWVDHGGGSWGQQNYAIFETVYTDYTISHSFAYTNDVTVEYAQASAASASLSETVDPASLTFEIVSGTDDAIAPGSLLFEFAGETYYDLDGLIYKDFNNATGAGVECGAINYGTRKVTLTSWTGGASSGVELIACATISSAVVQSTAAFRTPTAPIRSESLQITATDLDGNVITASANEEGMILGPSVSGFVDAETGSVDLWFTTDSSDLTGASDVPVFTQGGRYNAVTYSYLPLDASIIGIDAVRLPSDGRVPIYRAGDAVMVMHTAETAPTAVANGTVIPTRTRIAWVKVIDANGATVTSGYSLDRATGDVTIDDATGMAGPVSVRHTIGDLRLVTDVQIDGTLTLARPLSHDFPAGSVVASCLLHGDRRARVSATWDETTWSGEWLDYREGDAATATPNFIDYPISVTNEGCDTDRWLLRCTNGQADQFELLSEARGLVWEGTWSPGNDANPINPRTRVFDSGTGTYVGGTPYMTIPGEANGGGWSTGNVVRINTVGAIADVWILRSIAQSDPPAGDGLDGAEIYCLGNVDRP